MHLRITADSNSESGVGEIACELSGPTRGHFVAKDYGVGLLGVVVVLMGRNPALNFKRRVRLSKKNKTLYMDIMLDLEDMKSASPEKRRRIIIHRLSREIPKIMLKYKMPEFARDQFFDDLRMWLDVLDGNDPLLPNK
jgi:hypothetical protein